MGIVDKHLAFAWLQIATEAYLDQYLSIPRAFDLQDVLSFGNNHPAKNSSGQGATRFTPSQFSDFSRKFEIVGHYPSDQSGLSASLFRDKSSGEITLSFRSTEYQYGEFDTAKGQDRGGDWARDGAPGADGQINAYGFGLAQIDSMETLYAHLRAGEAWDFSQRRWVPDSRLDALKAGARINVTGYSLGGHLATAFTLLHPQDVIQTYNFNAAGVGGIGASAYVVSAPTGAQIADLLRIYREMIGYALGGQRPTDATPWARLLSESGEYWRYLWSGSETRAALSHSMAGGVVGIVSGNRYSWPVEQLIARVLGRTTVGVGVGESYFDLFDGLGDRQLFDKLARYRASGQNASQGLQTDLYTVDAWREKITQLYGHGEFFDPEFVANGGYHAPSTKIWIEDLPTSRALGFLQAFDVLERFKPRNWSGDFGETHSITPLIDSLTLLSVFQMIDQSVENDRYTTIQKAIVNTRFELGGTAPVLAGLRSFLSGLVSLREIPIAELSRTNLNDPDAIEETTNALAKLFLGTDQFIGQNGTLLRLAPDISYAGYALLAKRTELHDQLRKVAVATSLYRNAGATFTLESLTAKSAAELARFANRPDGLSYRYALIEGLPFTFNTSGDLFNRKNVGGELDLFSASTRSGALTVAFIDDRAKMHESFLRISAENSGAVETTGDEAWRYTSAAARQIAFAVTPPPIKVGDWWLDGFNTADLQGLAHRTTFGSGGADALFGGKSSDRLYGDASTDLLQGGAGNDYLEGGRGVDIYQFEAAVRDGGLGITQDDGADVVRDIDGRGILRFSEYGAGIVGRGELLRSTFVAGAFVADPLVANRWNSLDRRTVITRVPGMDESGRPSGQYDLSVRRLDTRGGDLAGSIIIRDWREGDFGIRLLDGLDGPVLNVERIIEGGEIDGNLPADGLGNPGTRPGTLAANVANRLFGSGQRDRIDGGGGNDDIRGDFANGVPAVAPVPDQLVGGAGRDRIRAGPGNDLIEGGADGVGAGDFIEGGAGNDRIFGATAIPLVDAIREGDTATYTSLSGGQAASSQKGDLILAGLGNDVVVTSNGDDVLFGGGGSDVLVGGAGADALFGDGNARVVGDWVGTPTWTVVRRPRDYTLTADQVSSASVATYRNAFVNLYFEIGFDDPQTGAADLIYGGAGDDFIAGEAGNDTLDGGSGNDTINGGAGDDIIDAGAGNDIVSGDDPLDTATQQGADVIEGGAGNDVLFGMGGDDALFGGDGDDILEGGPGSDILVGGRGVDVLRGGSGKDTYVFNKGDGVETIIDPDDRNRTAATDGPAANPNLSVIVFGVGLSPTEVRFRIGSLLIDLGHGDAVHLALPDGQRDPSLTRVFDRLDFADGATITFDDMLARGFDIEGTERIADTFDEAGNPVPGQDGNDILEGTGNLIAGDRIRGLSGDDSILGGAGDDLIIGGRDNDRLMGQAGDDIYVFERGDGEDLIIDTEGASTLRFGAGIAATNLRPLVTRQVDISTGQAFDVLQIFYGDQPGDRVSVLGGAALGATRYELADGSVLTQGQLLSRIVLPLLLRGGADADVLAGGAGDDRLEGAVGDDLLDGGRGRDRLAGGAGDDTYLFMRGSGSDFIDDTEGTNTVSFGAGIALTDLEVSLVNAADGGVLLAIDTGGGDALQVRVDFSVDAALEPRFRFDDGSVLGARALLAGRAADGFGFTATGSAIDIAGGSFDDVIVGAAGDDSISGGGGADVLVGGEGSDLLDGGDGDDILVGGAGDDWLAGGGGTDRYALARGMGQDILFEDQPGVTNRLVLGDGLVLADLAAEREGDDLRVRIRHSDEGVVLAGYFNAPVAWHIEQADGSGIAVADWIADLPPEPPATSAQVAVDRFVAGARAYVASALAQGGYALDEEGRWVRRSTVVNGYFSVTTTYRVRVVAPVETSPGGTYTQAAAVVSERARVSSVSESIQTVVVSDTSQARRVAVGGGGYVSGIVAPSGQVLLGFPYSDPSVVSTLGGYAEPVFGSGAVLSGGSLTQSLGGLTRPLVGFFVHDDSNLLHETVAQAPGVPPQVIRRAPTATLQATLTRADEAIDWDLNLATVRGGDGGTRVVVDGGAAAIGGEGADVLWARGVLELPVAAVAHPLRRPGALLYGAGGDDQLYGAAGDDVLVAGTGSDWLIGAGGRDRYVILPGDGITTVFDLIPNAALGRPDHAMNGANAPLRMDGGMVELPAGVAAGDLRFSWSDQWLPVFRNSNRSHDIGYMADLPLNTLTAVLNVSWDNAAGRHELRIAMPRESENGGIAALRFADGGVWSRADLLAAVPAHALDPGAVANGVTGTNLDGEAGDDSLAGGGILRGGEGDDTLAGGAGNDALTGDEGRDTLSGGDGDDLLGFGVREFVGAGNVYRGGRGRDIVLGTQGADLFVFERGDGADTIGDFWHDPNYSPLAVGWLPNLVGGTGPGIEWQSAYSDAYYFAVGRAAIPVRYSGTDVLRFGAGIVPGELTFLRARADLFSGAPGGGLPPGVTLPPGVPGPPGRGSIVEDPTGADLVIRVGAGGDSIRIPAYFTFQPSSYHARSWNSFDFATDRNFLGRIEFADGSVWDRASLDARVSSLGNRPPVALGTPAAIELAIGDVVDTVLLPEGFVDPNPGDTLTYRLASADGDAALPDWLVFSASTRRLSGTVPVDATDLDLVLTATDPGGASAALPVMLHVGERVQNHAPLAASVGSAFTAWEDAPGFWFLPEGAFADPDAGDVLRFEARTWASPGVTAPLPAWLAVDAGTGALYGLASNADVGHLAIEMTAIDMAGARASRVFDLDVRNTNDAPRAALALGMMAIEAGHPVSLSLPVGTFVDEDSGDTLDLSATLVGSDGATTGLPDWLDFDADSATFLASPGDAAIGAYRLRVSAADGENASAQTEFTLTVASAHGQDGAGGNDASGDSISLPLSPDNAIGGRAAGTVATGLTDPGGASIAPLAGMPGAGEALPSTATTESIEPIAAGAPARADDGGSVQRGINLDAVSAAIRAFESSGEDAADNAVEGRVGTRAADPDESVRFASTSGLGEQALLDALLRFHLQLQADDGAQWGAGSAVLDLGLGVLGTGLNGSLAIGSSEGAGLAPLAGLAGLEEGFLNLRG